ncbi:hypothetical protein EAF00_001323 [Botryotinia globosa]|nr:hypothetical protein EAF00_001323 [Botryotinia globosa]
MRNFSWEASLLWGLPLYNSASESCKKYAGKVDTPDVYLSIGFDTITENDTPRLPPDIVSAMGHGKRKLVLTLPRPEKYSNLEDVEVFKSAAALLDTNAQDVSASSFNDFLKDALERKYVVIGSPVAIIKGGIASAQKFFDILKGGISGKRE